MIRQMILFSALASYLLSTAAFAQDAVHRSAAVASDQQIRLSYHFNVDRDCSPALPPEVRVLTPLQQGQLAIRSGNVKVPNIQSCRNIEAPARVVFYQSNAGFTGQDNVTYETTKADATTEAHSHDHRHAANRSD